VSRCCKTLWGPRGNSWQCTRNAVVERDGKGYCKQHDPVAEKARFEARRTKWEEESKRESAVWALRSDAVASYKKNCGDKANKLAEDDLLGVSLDFVRQIMGSLPTNRDWLDPEVEKLGKAILFSLPEKGVQP
jgi:hypothetical protein